jgi:hypothetical protein
VNLDDLAEWLERHPEIESVTITEVTETVVIPELPQYFNELDG